MCGLCLPHCPTYGLAQREADGPRGRISLARALATDDLSGGPDLSGALDRCLACRRCEAVCPAGVQYGELISEARGLLASGDRTPWRVRAGHWLVRSRPRMLRATTLLRLAQTLGLVRLAALLWPKRSTLKQALSELPRIPARPKRRDHNPAAAGLSNQGKIGLHLGCVTDNLAPDIADDAIKVLNALGFDVITLPKQVCCGSLAQHAGRRTESKQLAKLNGEAFQSRAVSEVLLSATGCSAHASEHWPSTITVSDLCQFLAEQSNWPRLRLPPLRGRVLVQIPCTQRFPLNQASTSERLLARIPGLEMVEMHSGGGCCGAAGSYFMRHPDWATQLRDDLLTANTLSNGDIIVSANIGCAQHLSAGLRNRGLDVEVLHPVNLIARALKADRDDATNMDSDS